jgi:hypothetical protein
MEKGEQVNMANIEMLSSEDASRRRAVSIAEKYSKKRIYRGIAAAALSLTLLLSGFVGEKMLAHDNPDRFDRNRNSHVDFVYGQPWGRFYEKLKEVLGENTEDAGASQDDTGNRSGEGGGEGAADDVAKSEPAGSNMGSGEYVHVG